VTVTVQVKESFRTRLFSLLRMLKFLHDLHAES